MMIDLHAIRPDLDSHAKAFIEASLARTKVSKEPRLIHMCGIPGAGKTTYTNFFLNQNPHFALVQFDSVMEALPGYKEKLRASGAAAAFAEYESPARIIGYHLLDALVASHRDVFFDHGALNRNHVSLLEEVSKKGFSVEVHYIECELEVAFDRIFKREQFEGRHTPQVIVRERHALLQELLPVYRQLAHKFVAVDPSVYIDASPNLAWPG